MNITARLTALERKAATLFQGKQLVTVIFRDGRRERIPAADVIDLFAGPVGQLADVIGTDTAGSGQLVSLLRGMLE